MRGGVNPGIAVAALAVLSSFASAADRICNPGSTVTIAGTVGKAQEGGFVLEPFEVGAGVTEISITATQTASLTLPGTPAGQIKNTLDFGTRGPNDTFRGWNHPTATFSSESATRSYHRGSIVPGTWSVEVGVAAIIVGTTSDYSVSIVCSDPPRTVVPWTQLRSPDAPVSGDRGPDWYAGDLHVHSRDSSDSPGSLADRPNGSTVDAIGSYAQDVAKLDWLSLTDHNTDGHLDDLGAEQSEWSGKRLLIIPGTEVTTYHGHTNWHGGAAAAPEEAFVEYRTGPVWIRNPDSGALTVHSEGRSPNEIFDDVHARGALTQVNHPTQFNDPVSSNLCRGCAWDYPDTDWSRVDLFEVQTAPPGLNAVPNQTFLGPNPFTLTAILMWDRLLLEGYRITGVGTSDDHRAGSSPSVTQSPIGTPATVVYAKSLSEQAILDALKAGHAYIRFWGPEGPHVELTAPEHPGRMMGDTIEAAATMLRARVVGGPAGQLLRIIHNGLPVGLVPVVGEDFTFDFPATGTGFWRIETVIGVSFQALTNPIFLELPGAVE